MPKPTLVFACSKCDAQFPKWSGRCEACNAWGTLHEETVAEETKEKSPPRPAGKLTSFDTLQTPSSHLLLSSILPFDQVLGGGLVPGSVTLVAGEPGIGKSTLLAQMAIALAATNQLVMYVTGEESPTQVRRRLTRLSPTLPEALRFLDDTNADIIAATIRETLPALVIVDSIQSVRTEHASGEAGSVTQVKASAAIITEAAKKTHVPTIFVGQVTKDGDIAGPRVLEHLVDTVLFLEGDHEHRYRLLRALKNRFGNTDEVAILAMSERGLEPVEDPSHELLRDRAGNVPGSAVTCLIEGQRPLLLELQALVSHAGYGTPTRRATGVDPGRLGMLLAVLARRAGVNALEKDVYANAVGGIDARDQSVDLAVTAAIASATKDKTIPSTTAFFGEVGLAGELRPVGLPEARVKELARLGFTHIIAPGLDKIKAPNGVTLTSAKTLREALESSGIIS